MFADQLDKHFSEIPPTPDNYKKFVETIHRAGKASIPHDLRKHCNPALDNKNEQTLSDYHAEFGKEPF